MAFFGTDSSEKKASKSLSVGPQLDSTKAIDKQAKYLSNFFAQEDDLTFKESSVKNVSDRGRGQVVELLIEALHEAVKRHDRAAAKKAATAELATPGAASSSSTALVAAPLPVAPAPVAPPWVHEEVLQEVKRLQRIRTRGWDSSPLVGAEPLRRLASLPVDSSVLKRTKVALELNQDFWKNATAPEVRRMVAVLVREWKAMYRSANGKPSSAEEKPRVFSERTLRNAATDLEGNAYGRSPQNAPYQVLVKALLTRLKQAPEQAMGLLEGGERAQALVKRVHERSIADATKNGVKRARREESGA